MTPVVPRETGVPGLPEPPAAAAPLLGDRLDLMASYAVTPKTTVQLNVNNLLDKKYYRNVGFYDSVFWGEPRNVNLSLRTTF